MKCLPMGKQKLRQELQVVWLQHHRKEEQNGWSVFLELKGELWTSTVAGHYPVEKSGSVHPWLLCNAGIL